MIHPFRGCQSHGRLQDSSRLARYSLRALEQQLKPRVSHKRMFAADAVQAMRDEAREALPLHYRREVHAQVQTAGHRRQVAPVKGLSQSRMPDEPDGHQVAGVEGEVQEGGKVPEEVQGEILRFIDDPYGKDVLAVGQLDNP